MSGIATNRTNITLPADISAEIMQKVRDTSAVMQLARQIPLPGRGAAIQVITGDPTASWVDETDAKPVSNPSLTTKIMQAYKLAVIVPFSDEFRRDAAALYDAIVARLPGALAYKFDQTVIGAVLAPGGNFDGLGGCQTQSIVDGVSYKTYDGLVGAYTDIANNGGALNGFALSPSAKGILLGATDSQGRPIFINSAAEGAVPMILGARAVEGRGCFDAGTAGTSGTPDVVGIAGDWNQAMYGTVEGVKIDFADQTGLTMMSGTPHVQVNLWEHNMFAVRAEIEVGFRANTSVFNLLTGNVPEE